MNNNYRKEQELQAREKELEQRTLELRLRELDAEINHRSVPFYPTEKDQDQKLARTLKQDLVTVAKFSGLFLGGIAVVYISQWLAWITVFASISAAGYFWFKFRANKSK
jgi:C4-dicarboxylate-specific signal transduction histidine kinase